MPTPLEKLMESSTERTKNMNKRKRLLAIAGLILMGILIAGAIILAIIGTEAALRLLMADLFCLMVVPAVLYGYQMFFHMANRKSRKDDKETQDLE